MSDDLVHVEAELQGSAALQQQQVSSLILGEAPRLVRELLDIIYSDDLDVDGRPIVDAKVKLSAIGMLLDRSVPKLAVAKADTEVIEESKTRKKIKEEIKALMALEEE